MEVLKTIKDLGLSRTNKNGKLLTLLINLIKFLVAMAVKANEKEAYGKLKITLIKFERKEKLKDLHKVAKRLQRAPLC